MKVVVIDDDPTGSQTVHSCPLLLRWDVDTLRKGLRHASPLLFLLADTRALMPTCLLYTSPSPRDVEESRMPSSA